ncbi:unnamed protein product [Rhodiola kirilowii]
MAMLTLTEANLLLIPKGQTSLQDRVVSADSKREAVDLLPKASGYLKFCIEDILVHIPADIRFSDSAYGGRYPWQSCLCSEASSS